MSKDSNARMSRIADEIAPKLAEIGVAYDSDPESLYFFLFALASFAAYFMKERINVPAALITFRGIVAKLELEEEDDDETGPPRAN